MDLFKSLLFYLLYLLILEMKRLQLKDFRDLFVTNGDTPKLVELRLTYNIYTVTLESQSF